MKISDKMHGINCVNSVNLNSSIQMDSCLDFVFGLIYYDFRRHSNDQVKPLHDISVTLSNPQASDFPVRKRPLETVSITVDFSTVARRMKKSGTSDHQGCSRSELGGASGVVATGGKMNIINGKK